MPLDPGGHRFAVACIFCAWGCDAEPRAASWSIRARVCELVLPYLELRVEVSVLGVASCVAAGAAALARSGEIVAVPRCTDGPRRACFVRFSLRSCVVVFLEVPLLVHFLFVWGALRGSQREPFC